MFRSTHTYVNMNRRISNRITLFLMAFPCVVLVVAFNYLPLFGWLYGVFDYKPGMSIFKCRFVGLKFLIQAISDPQLVIVLRNTLMLGLLNLLISVLPVLFAIFLTELRGRRIKRIIQTVTTFPNFISWVLVFSIFFIFLSVEDGYVNKALLATGVISDPLNLLADEGMVWLLQVFISIWKSVGFSAIIYLASIAGIDPGMYDAANVDGASRFNKILHITIPELMPTFFTLLLLGIGNILSNGFEQYYLFYNNLVSDKILVLDVYLYQVGLGMNQYSLSIVLGMTKTIISLLLLFSANGLSKLVRGSSIL